MIDLETAISWAKEAGFYCTDEGTPIVKTADGSWLNLEYKIGALIAKAQKEAFEVAAQRAEGYAYMSQNFLSLASDLRELKDQL